MNATDLGPLLDVLAERVADRVVARLAAAKEPGDEWIALVKNGTCTGVRTRRIIDAAARGELVLGRLGRTPAVRRSELDRWIASRTTEPRKRRTDCDDDDAEVIELAAQRLAKRSKHLG